MAVRIWGPHVTGSNFLGIHLGAVTEVEQDTSGATIPDGLSIQFSGSPVGGSTAISPIRNGQSGTVNFSPGITLTGTVNNCRTQPAGGGAPEHFIFQFTIRAAGTAKPIPIPISVQIDAFDVVLPTKAADRHQMLENAAASIG